MNRSVIPPEVEKSLRDVIREIRKEPQPYVRNLAIALFIAEALLLAQVFRVMNIAVFLLIFISIHMTHQIEMWLDEIATFYNVPNKYRGLLLFWPTSVGMWIHMFETGGRIPVISSLTDISAGVVVAVGAIIYGVMYFSAEFSNPIERPQALPENVESSDDSDTKTK